MFTIKSYGTYNHYPIGIKAGKYHAGRWISFTLPCIRKYAGGSLHISRFVIQLRQEY